ncbi:TPA: PLP-dependent aminotransferase family protein, partial [Acinetobacter baumannii]|nr:PLP-dependent aminotransferase family protein [Acinetobacter baumannii]
RFRNIVQQLKFTTTVAEPALLTETLGLFLENGGYDLHLRQLKKRYQQQIDAIKSYICRYFPVGTRVSRPQAGFILWLELPESIDTLELFHQAMDEKILCMPGILCSADKRFSHCLRIAACFELNPRMLNALMRLGELTKNMLPVQKDIDQIPTNSVG